MDRLPDELVLSCFFRLDPRELVSVQLVCRRFCTLGRDDSLWKINCFDRSAFEARRCRNEQMLMQGPLAELRRSMPILPRSNEIPNDKNRIKFSRADDLTNWDPVRPGEQTNYYQEFMQRHGITGIEWYKSSEKSREAYPRSAQAIGIGVFEGHENGLEDCLLAPLEDGSLRLWDIANLHIRETRIGALVFDQRDKFDVRANTNNEVYAMENVSINSQQKKAYVAMRDQVNEIDLNTLQVIRSSVFPFQVACLGPAGSTSITVGTMKTLNIHDSRDQGPGYGIEDICCEPGIGTQENSSDVWLSEPYPLSIVHAPDADSDDIWVAGRFKSLLNYDRRYWPRIRSTLYSGAMLSSLTVMKNSYIPRDLNLYQNFNLSMRDLQMAKRLTGTTLVAAGQYRGIGSLELHGLPRSLGPEVPPHLKSFYEQNCCFKNRQSVARSRLLSVAQQGLRLVYSDSHGNLKWMERDGASPVCQVNINDFITTSRQPESSLFQSSVNERGYGDFAQRIVSIRKRCESDLNDIAILTTEGRIGKVSYRRSAKLSSGEDHDESERDTLTIQQERQYNEEMRRALERQADDARIARGFGLAFISDL